MRGEWSKVMGGDRCVYGQWAIDVTSPLIASEIMRIKGKFIIVNIIF
jgi:hypothetical protein